MTRLARCDTLFGNFRIVREEPDYRTHEAVYLPGIWGLFDHGRRLITSSAYYRGPHPDLVGCNIPEARDWPASIDVVDDIDYFFLGPVHAHYGHFLLSTFSRLWALRKRGGVRPKLVTYALPTIARHPYIPALLEAVGCSIDDCVSFDRPTLLPRIAIAAPSFEETNFVHVDFQILCGWVADALAGDYPRNSSSDPVYLAKYALTRGVAALDNEEAIAEALEKRGVEVVFPEQLPLREQIRLFRDRSSFAGLVGSAFHTAAFVTGKNLSMLNYNAKVFTNQLLIDRVCRHNSIYVFPEAGVIERKRDNFSVNYSLVNPAETAEQFARLFDRVSNRQRLPCIEETADFLPEEVNGARNLGRGRSAVQSSSASVVVEGRERNPAEAALSGFLLGSPQSRTRDEPDPWWRVDLGREAVLVEGRFFEVFFAESVSPPDIEIDLSSDLNSWISVTRERLTTETPDARSRRTIWQPETSIHARFLRVRLDGLASLALDQVAVYGFFLP